MKSDIKVGHQGPKFVLWCWFVFLGFCPPLCDLRGFPGGSVGKESACNSGDLGSIPGSEGSPREGNGNPLQYSYLENSMDRGTWRATVRGVSKESDMT